MSINHSYLLKVLLMVSLMTAFICALSPDIRAYPNKIGPEGFEYRLGFFCGVFVFEIDFSLTIFICLYLIYFLLTTKYHVSALFMRFILIFCFLPWVFLYSRLNYDKWIHPFFIAYAGVAICGFFIFDVYKADPFYEKFNDDLELIYWNEDNMFS